MRDSVAEPVVIRIPVPRGFGQSKGASDETPSPSSFLTEAANVAGGSWKDSIQHAAGIDRESADHFVAIPTDRDATPVRGLRYVHRTKQALLSLLRAGKQHD